MECSKILPALPDNELPDNYGQSVSMNRIYFYCLIACMGSVSTAALAEGFTFTGKDALQLVAQELAKQDASSDMRVEIAGIQENQPLATSESPIIGSLTNFTADATHNRFKTTLILVSNQRNLTPLSLSGRYDEMVEVLALRKATAMNEVIRAEDVQTIKYPKTNLRNNTITDINDLVGKSPKHGVSEGRPIRTDEIAFPALIKRGSKVTLMYKSANIEIRTVGEALEDGAKGSMIKVKNTTSKAVVDGVVESSERVIVSSVYSGQ